MPVQEELSVPAEIPEGGLAIGTAGGIAIDSVSAGGHWVAYCQAKDQDVPIGPRGTPRVAAALWFQQGENVQQIDALLAKDPRGRYVVIYAGETAWLVDAITHDRVSLAGHSVDLRADAWENHRSFAFSADGRRLFLLTRGPAAPHEPRAVILDVAGALADSDPKEHARQLDLPEGTPWRLAAEGEHLVVHMAPGQDSTRWPVPEADLPNRCAGGMTTFEAYGPSAEPRSNSGVTTYLLSLTKFETAGPSAATELPALQPRHAPGYLFSFRQGWVRRTDEGRLLFVEGKTQRQIASSRCGARVLHADQKSGYFLIACEEYRPVPERSSTANRQKPKYRFSLYLVRPGEVIDLNADVMRTGVDVSPTRGPRFVPLRPGSTAALMDFEKKKLIQLDEGTSVMATSDQGAMLRAGRTLSFFDGHTEVPLESKFVPLSPVVRADAGIVIGRQLFRWKDLMAGEPAVEIPGAVVALTEEGHVLVAQEPASANRWARGPLVLLPAATEAPASASSGPSRAQWHEAPIFAHQRGDR